MDGNNVEYTYHPGGRIESITDGTGHRKLGYDALGNLVHEDRYIAIPNSANVLAFHTEYTYDSWGRMRTMTYPDGEKVDYTYRWGGDLHSVHGTKGADSCRYIDSIAYNALGQRAYIHYGNGTMASYTYDALHRLIGLESSDSLGNTMQKIKYDFDPSSNITHIANSAPNIGPLGGRYQNYYKYDPLHRLTRAGGSDQYGFEQAFELSRAGRPLSTSTNGMVKHYAYGEHTPPHAPQRIMVERRTLHDLRWDPAGNLGQVSTLAHDRGDIQSRFLFWTEDSRLHTVVDDRHHSYYAYDHTGERTMKVTGHSHQLDVNADLMHTAAGLDEFTLYPSPYLVFTNRGYTKHYYAGTERLAARIGGGFDRPILHEQTDLAMTATHLFKQSQHHSNERHLNAPPAHTIRRDHLSENIYRDITKEFGAPMHLVTDAVIKSNNLISTAQNIVSGNAEPNVYFYHSDHLGSASWITDGDGIPVQHLQYLPYGEPFVNQRAAGSTYSERFRFTGKERDAETGYGYFGARYMDHELLTMWLSVDPLADKYPNISPYNYCMWNPMKLVDPDGREAIDDGWIVDNQNKTITRVNSYGGDYTQYVEGDGSSVRYNTSRGELLNEYKDYKVIDNVPGFSQLNPAEEKTKSEVFSPESFIGTMVGGIGSGCDKMSKALFDYDNGTYMGKDGSTKIMQKGKNGGLNGRYQSQLELSAKYGKVASGLNWLGRGMAVLSVASTEIQAYNGEISSRERITNHIVNGVSFLPNCWHVSFFYELGKKYGPSKW